MAYRFIMTCNECGSEALTFETEKVEGVMSNKIKAQATCSDCNHAQKLTWAESAIRTINLLDAQGMKMSMRLEVGDV